MSRTMLVKNGITAGALTGALIVGVAGAAYAQSPAGGAPPAPAAQTPGGAVPAPDAGALAGAVLPDPAALGVGVVFPLAFLGLLVPMLRGGVTVLVALLSGLGAWLLSRVLPGGLVVLLAGVGGALLGAFLVTRRGGPEASRAGEGA